MHKAFLYWWVAIMAAIVLVVVMFGVTPMLLSGPSWESVGLGALCLFTVAPIHGCVIVHFTLKGCDHL